MKYFRFKNFIIYNFSLMIFFYVNGICDHFMRFKKYTKLNWNKSLIREGYFCEQIKRIKKIRKNNQLFSIIDNSWVLNISHLFINLVLKFNLRAEIVLKNFND